MEKKYIYIILPVAFLLVAGFVIFRYTNTTNQNTNQTYSFIPRVGNNSQAEWQMAKKNADKLISKVNADPSNTKAMMALANAYIIESRTSGNYAYYDNAALQTIKNVLELEPGNYEAMMLQALVELSQHHFSEALATANKSLNIDSNSAFIYGLLVDANVELGNYTAAVDAAEKMISRRPDLRSYSRISYLREIHGDYSGAIEAMEMAVASGTATEENTEWSRTQLAKLYENTGNVKKASFLYQLSLAARPQYPPALAGLGRIALFEKKYDSAVYFFEQASLSMNDLASKQHLLQAYQMNSQNNEAAVLQKEIETSLRSSSNSDVHDDVNGHYEDRELAYTYIQLGKLDKALQHATAEYTRRPLNIEVNETMAWTLYKKNEAAKALPYIQAALKTNSPNPVLLTTAGLIYIKNGETNKGKEFINRALKNNPVLSGELKQECLIALQQ